MEKNPYICIPEHLPEKIGKHEVQMVCMYFGYDNSDDVAVKAGSVTLSNTFWSGKDFVRWRILEGEGVVAQGEFKHDDEATASAVWQDFVKAVKRG